MKWIVLLLAVALITIEAYLRGFDAGSRPQRGGPLGD